MIYPATRFRCGIGGGCRITERKLAVVPRVVVSGPLGEKEYGVLLTDRRMIFVLERTSRIGIAAGLGGVAGAVIAETAAERREFVYADADPEALAGIDGTIVVENSSVRRVRLKRSMTAVTYAMRIEYATADGKTKKLNCLLSPPDDHMNRRVTEGVKFKVVLADYAKKVQEAFRMTLPLDARENSEWMK